ncbi:MAG TPA: ATP-binding protein [Verrucomicrobiae bacterium]|jgi:signal transduction histidine kinase/ActR/RegA family two-component response regulator|nr:ATP-binding protein [Verrucomicrobiae bacterium]
MTAAKHDPNRRILVIDDNRAIHRDFQKIFGATAGDAFLEADEAALFGKTVNSSSRRQFEIDSAFQGQEGLAMVEKAVAEGRPYAMAFVDVRMPPGWDGVETISHLWKVCPDLQVVVCTAYSDYSWDEMRAKLGESDQLVILKKPFDSIEVLQLTGTMVEKWRLLQQSRLHLIELEATVDRRTEELQSKTMLFEALVDASLDGILVVNNSNHMVVQNQKFNELLKIPPHVQVMEHDDERLQFVTDSAKNPEQFQEKVRYLYSHPLETSRDEIEFNDGRVLDRYTAPVLGEGKKCYGRIWMFRDITHRKQNERAQKLMEAQLRQAQKLEAVGQLAAGIAHEINTPTQYVGDNTRFLKDAFAGFATIMRSHVELLAAAKQNALTPELLERAEAALQASDIDYLFEQIPAAITETLEGVDRITKIVRAMKEFSHPGGKEKTPADLNKAIESTVTVARNEWKYVADLTLDLAKDLPMVPCFLGEFNQAILNLIVNASHAIQDVVKTNPGTKGAIHITTRRTDDSVEVRVSDSGTGIAEVHRAHIFEPFFTTKDVGKGTGQGLSVIYSCIVKKHAGTVRFETELGKGTTFIVSLPVNPEKPVDESHEQPAAVEHAMSAPLESVGK